MNSIEQIKKTNEFTWGEPVKFWEIGPYTVLEFHPWKKGSAYEVFMRVPSEEIEYHGWIDGKDTNTSWPTLETCIAGVIGQKYAGNNNGGVS